ncbi:copper amine oxidase N-terminal domain-containing protein [Paenibacillus herberti]|nr:copper amine oxidase N-terminal domain-containing protein [Paenibacillus herberti]
MLKKWIKVLVGCALLSSSLLFTSTSVHAAAPSVFVNGELQGKAITVNERTLVKLRALTDPEWLVFAYDPKTRIVMFHTKDNRIKVELREGEKTATVNGKKVPIDAAVVNKGGLTYIPIRFISETLGAYVKYFAEDNRVIVRTPRYETLMQGDLTKARLVAMGLPKIQGDAPAPESGEGYHSRGYIFPEGEALRFIFNDAGYSYGYYEVNEQGMAILKWQYDDVAEREWGTKPAFKRSVYFDDFFMSGLFNYGTMDAEGKRKELGSFKPEQSYSNIAMPIEGEKRTDARPEPEAPQGKIKK